jgi:hypothetical protein
MRERERERERKREDGDNKTLEMNDSPNFHSYFVACS